MFAIRITRTSHMLPLILSFFYFFFFLFKTTRESFSHSVIRSNRTFFFYFFEFDRVIPSFNLQIMIFSILPFRYIRRYVPLFRGFYFFSLFSSFSLPFFLPPLSLLSDSRRSTIPFFFSSFFVSPIYSSIRGMVHFHDSLSFDFSTVVFHYACVDDEK